MGIKGQMVLPTAGTAGAGFLSWWVPKSKHLYFHLLEGLSVAEVVSSEVREEDRHFPLAVMVLFQKTVFQDEVESI